jgi:hypothetical protein
MEHILHIELGNEDESRDLELAKAMTEALVSAYPNHYWLVSFTGHALIVRHVLIASMVALATGQDGFGSLLGKDKVGTVHEAQAEAVKHGGAMLEAFKLPRGPWDGATVPVVPEDLKREILGRRKLRWWKPTS